MSLLMTKNKLQVVQKATILTPGVELIGIINKLGRMTEYIGTELPLTDSKREMFFMKIALRTSMQKDFDDELGNVDYCMTKRGLKQYISIPTFDNNTIFVITQKDADYEKVIENISQTIIHSEEFLGIPIPNGSEV